MIKKRKGRDAVIQTGFTVIELFAIETMFGTPKFYERLEGESYHKDFWKNTHQEDLEVSIKELGERNEISVVYLEDGGMTLNLIKDSKVHKLMTEVLYETKESD